MSIANAVDEPRSRAYYYSLRYNNEVGIQFFKKLTGIITTALPNARVGANFSPLDFYNDPRDGNQYGQLYVPDPVRLAPSGSSAMLTAAANAPFADTFIAISVIRTDG